MEYSSARAWYTIVYAILSPVIAIITWYMKSVTIYSTPSCHFCQLAKAFFKEHNISYTEHDVASDAERRKEMVELSGQLGVPVIHVDDTVLVGFQEKLLSDLLLAK